MTDAINKALEDWLKIAEEYIKRPNWQVVCDIKNQPFFGREKNPVMVKFRSPVPFVANIPKKEGEKIAVIKPHKILWCDVPSHIQEEYESCMCSRDSEEYKKQMLGEFAPDQRAIDLHDRLQKYYDDTPDCMNNAKARPIWKEFVRWCGEHEYTQEDINTAKRLNKFEMNRTTNK